MIPQTITVTSSISVFYFLGFFCFTIFSCRFRAVELTRVGFRAHVKMASRIVFVSFEITKMLTAV